MKYVKLFEEYVNGNKINSKVYHVSLTPIDNKSLATNPMWFALEKSHSDDGWFKNASDEGSAYQYEGKVSGKVSYYTDEDVVDIFDKIDVDPEEWVMDLVSNPEPQEIMSLKGTKALIKAGYAGIVHADYDPRDFSKDLDSLIIFNPKKSIKGFKLINSKE